MRHLSRLHLLPIVLALAGAGIFGVAQSQLGHVKRVSAGADIEVTLPVFVQVVLAGGDRYLAASWAAVRALVTETVRMKPDDYQILARVQQDASWLNPAHEDNYYTAAAILPWEGQVQATQIILRRATAARPFDVQPPFYYGFYMVHFLDDALGAAEWLRRAALYLPNSDERLMLQDVAARWLARSQDLDMAARIVDAMAAQTKRKDFADYLHKRSQRLRDLAMLRRAADEYRQRVGRPPNSLADLQSQGFVKRIPADPLGVGYGLNPAGLPVGQESLKK